MKDMRSRAKTTQFTLKTSVWTWESRYARLYLHVYILNIMYAENDQRTLRTVPSAQVSPSIRQSFISYLPSCCHCTFAFTGSSPPSFRDYLSLLFPPGCDARAASVCVTGGYINAPEFAPRRHVLTRLQCVMHMQWWQGRPFFTSCDTWHGDYGRRIPKKDYILWKTSRVQEYHAL